MTMVALSNPSQSTTYNANFYPVSNCIDGNTATLCCTAAIPTVAAGGVVAWSSVQVPAGTVINYVVVYNRADGDPYQSWLDPYEVWLGSTPGAEDYQCGGGEQAAPFAAGLGPLTTSCGGQSGYSYVSIIWRPRTTITRYGSLGELQVYT